MVTLRTCVQRYFMSDKTSIEGTNATSNPVTGCTRVSPGCDHCYELTFAERFRGVPNHPYQQGFDLKLGPDRVELALGWKTLRRSIVNSMSELFHKQWGGRTANAGGRLLDGRTWDEFPQQPLVASLR